MGKWNWEGFDKAGKSIAGVIEGSSEREVRRSLRDQQIRIKRLRAPSILEFDFGEWMVEHGLAKSFGAKELMVFTKQLSIMLNAGVPILQALEIIFNAEKHPMLKRTVKQIAIDIKEGQTLSDAMTKQKGFSKLYCSLVKSGEVGGILDKILLKLAEFMERNEKIKAQIKSALMYPAIVTVIGIVVVWGMMIFVVPQFISMLEGTGQEPPAITQFVIDTSNFFKNYTLIMLPAFALIGFILLKTYIGTKEGKMQYDRLTMKAPIFADIIIKGNLATFCRTLVCFTGSRCGLA